MLTIAYAHQDAGRPAYIVTAASQDMAEVLAKVMSFDGALGSALSEIEDGVYTGRPTGAFLYGAAKAVAIEQMAARDNLDLGACYAYSDSVSDAPMLRAVGHPVVVNPDSELERLAREEGWEMVHLDRLGQRLLVAGILSGVAGLAGITALVLKLTGLRIERPRLRRRR
jgi:phosphoserine phosphatase